MVHCLYCMCQALLAHVTHGALLAYRNLLSLELQDLCVTLSISVEQSW